MENYEHIRDTVVNILTQRFGTVKDDGLWLNLRCPFCGDSDKSDKIHFGFKFPSTFSEDNSYNMNCFQPKCVEGKGTPSVQHLRQMGIDEVPGMVKLIELSLKNQGKGYKWIYKDFEFKVDDTEIFSNYIKPFKAKLDYFKKRTGISINSYSELHKYKIILDIEKFRKTYDIDAKAFGDKYRISFLNDGGSQVSTRAIVSPELIKKYNMSKMKKWNVRQVSEHTPYTLKRGIVDGSEPITLYIVEGVFDAINVFNRISTEPNCVVVNCNSIIAVNKCMSYILNLYNYNTEFVFVADGDIIEDELDFTKERKFGKTKIDIAIGKYSFYIPEIKVIWNDKNKDFGEVTEEWDLRSMYKTLK